MSGTVWTKSLNSNILLCDQAESFDYDHNHEDGAAEAEGHKVQIAFIESDSG